MIRLLVIVKYSGIVSLKTPTEVWLKKDKYDKLYVCKGLIDTF